MDPIELLRWFASGTATLAAIIVALRLRPTLTGVGFVIFTCSSLAWVAAGLLQDEYALLWQNAVLTAINLFGVWRWLLRTE